MRAVYVQGLMLMALTGLAQAEPGVSIEHVETRRTSTPDQASVWGLSANEWLLYQQIMNDRRGVWSPGLDPITALGVSADTVSERKRYAELYVRAAFDRTRKELAFQIAVDQAWARLYPETPRIGHRSFTSDVTQPPVRYALIVKPDCIECESVLAERLDGMIGEAEEGVDIHVVGTGGNDNVLKRWISSQPALLAALKDGSATVNHGSQFQDLGSFPAIYSKGGNGQWIREL